MAQKNWGWGSCVKQTLDKMGFSFVWNYGPHSNNFLSQFKQRIWDTLNCDMLSKVNEMKSLQFFRRVKVVLGRELYFRLGNKNARSVLARIRLGQWSYVKLGAKMVKPVICPFCLTEEEDVLHLIIKCSYYDNIRRQHWPAFLVYSDEESIQ